MTLERRRDSHGKGPRAAGTTEIHNISSCIKPCTQLQGLPASAVAPAGDAEWSRHTECSLRLSHPPARSTEVSVVGDKIRFRTREVSVWSTKSFPAGPRAIRLLRSRGAGIETRRIDCATGTDEHGPTYSGSRPRCRRVTPCESSRLALESGASWRWRWGGSPRLPFWA